MKTYIQFTILIILVVYGYQYFNKNSNDHVNNKNTTDSNQSATIEANTTQNTTHASDMQSLKIHMESLGPRLQTMPAGKHSFRAPSGKVYKYNVSKSGLFYCPKQRKNIYRNVSIRMVD